MAQGFRKSTRRSWLQNPPSLVASILVAPALRSPTEVSSSKNTGGLCELPLGPAPRPVRRRHLSNGVQGVHVLAAKTAEAIAAPEAQGERRRVRDLADGAVRPGQKLTRRHAVLHLRANTQAGEKADGIPPMISSQQVREYQPRGAGDSKAAAHLEKSNHETKEVVERVGLVALPEGVSHIDKLFQRRDPEAERR